MSAQVSIITNLPDGTAIGTDGNGNAYRGTPVKVAPDELGLWTTIADDGESFQRITHHGDDIVAWGTETRKGFCDAVQFRLPDVTDAELDEMWEAEKATANHKSATDFTYRVFEWEMI